MLKELDNYDWQAVFAYAGVEPEDVRGCVDGTPNVSAQMEWSGDVSGFTRDDVVEIIAMSDGDNDGPDWIGFFRLRDGRYAFVSAGCDYTGWGCRESGYAIVGGDKDDMVRLGIGVEDRKRLGLEAS